MSGIGVRISPNLATRAVSGLYARREVGGGGRGGRYSIALARTVVETVRLDVDGSYAQMIASGTYSVPFSILGGGYVHWIASSLVETSEGTWQGFIGRRWGDQNLLPHQRVTIRVPRTTIYAYSAKMTITFTDGAPDVTRELDFESPYFRTAQLEYDTVEESGRVTYVDTWAHPDRPTSLPNERLTITTAYDRAGIDLQQELNPKPVVPFTGTGEDEVWSDQELHDAMRAYWTRYKPRAQWALWLLFAGRHEDPTTKGMMFDNSIRNPNDRHQRQGAAVFADTIADRMPDGEKHQAEWMRRERFFAAVHEMGHCFNLLHSWEKRADEPWIPTVPQDELAKSFMNYPSRVSSDVSDFWEAFYYRFDDPELVFMRHAPEEFVEMGASLAGKGHGYTYALSSGLGAGARDPRFALELSVSRARSVYQFLEPITAELKLTNITGHPLPVDSAVLDDLRTPALAIRPRGGLTRIWRPYVRHCSFDGNIRVLQPGESLRARLFASAGVDGWYLAEPGSYTLQASLRSLGGHGGLGGDIVASPLTLRIASPRSWEEEYVAQNYFTDEVGRALALGGTSTMTSAIEALEEAANRLKGTAVARHAMLTLALPSLRSRKVLRLPEGEAAMSPVAADGGSIGVVEAKPDEANRLLREALLDDRRAAVETFGQGAYERYVEMYANRLEQSGDKAAAAKARSQSSEAQRSESGARAQSKGKPIRHD